MIKDVNMNTRYKILAITVLLLAVLAINTNAQNIGDSINIGTYHTIQSKILPEERIVSINLPRGYEASGLSYPVIYHSYGDRINQYFAKAVSSVYNLASDGAIPEVILVGIDEKNLRYRDLLPQGNDGSPTGINSFTEYISNELIPFIEQNYRTKDFNVFVGPQVGANFGLYTLFTNPELFNAYIITNPFRWTGGRELLFDKVNSYSSNQVSIKNFLFITYHKGDRDPLEKEGDLFIERFKKVIDEDNLEEINVNYNFIDDGVG